MRVDVLIIGAGAAGAAAAAILAPHVRVAMVDAATAPVLRVGEILPAAARKSLVAIGAWHDFVRAAHGAAPVRLSRWGSDDVVMLGESGDDTGDGASASGPDHAGWRINRQQFERDLRENAVMRGARLIVPVQVQAVSRIADIWRADIGGGRAIKARVVIDASGRTTRLLRPFGQQETLVDRLCCTYQIADQTDDDASSYIQSVEQGWWYSAALPGHRRLVAFHSDSDLDAARDVFAAGPLRMAAGIRGLDALMDGIDPDKADPPAMCAAFSSARSAAGKGWLAVGDAALSFDPLSSQGLFTALVTGIEGGRAALALFDGAAQDGIASDYAGLIGDVWSAYTRHHGRYYGIERRWADAPFWQRRHGKGDEKQAQTGVGRGLSHLLPT